MIIAAIVGNVVLYIGTVLILGMGQRDLGNRITALARDLDTLRRRLSVQLGGEFTHPARHVNPVPSAMSIDTVAATGLYDRDSSQSESVAGEPDPIVHIAHDNGTPFPDLTAHRVKRVPASPAPADEQPQ